MAERLTVLAAATLLAGAALAQPLADPTRPPMQASAAARQSEPPRQRLQSVLISARRSIAVIDGRPVALGERVGDATLISIGPSEVMLERGAARERLTLLPSAIEKRPVRP